MKLWIDDLRAAPPGWNWLKNNTEAIRAIDLWSDVITEISIDHDICHVSNDPGIVKPFACDETFEGTARFIVMWIWTLNDKEYDGRFKESGLPINIHTANPDGCMKLIEIFKSAGLRIKLRTTLGVAPDGANHQPAESKL